MTNRPDFYKANPHVVKTMMKLEERIQQSGLEQPLLELVRLRASQINGCAFCMDMHFQDAVKGGESVRRLATLSAWRESPFFTAREQAALAWTEAVTLVAQIHVPDEVWALVSEQFSDSEAVDLTLLINAINGWNRLAIAFRKVPA